MNVCNYLLQGKNETSPALLGLRSQHTYGELRAASASVAGFLLSAGAHKGERALLVAENSFFWVACYLGILRAGLVCVPLPPGLPAGDLAKIVAVTEPRFTFSDAKSARRAALAGVPLITDQPLPISSITLGEVQATDSIPFPEVLRDDLAALMFTSGSTGEPRGVMISHGNIIANTDSIIEYLALTPSDRIMTVLPFHYCFGTSLLHTHLRAGGSLVLDSRFMYPEVVLQRMRETGCTGFAGVPSHFQILLRKSNLRRISFPQLRYVQQAGGQLAPAFIQELRQALPGKQIFIMYGQTEATARLSYLPPECLETKLGSVGKGIPGVALSVVDENGEAVLPGQTGEIVATGDNVALGYWRDAEDSAHCFRNRKLYTGDLATVDSDGFIYIVDRAKDFLKCGGKRVSCRHLESVLLEHEELLEAAIIGVPDKILGEAAVAFVVPRDRKSSLTAEQLRNHCRRQLPPPLVPQAFVMLPSLPKNSSGKVLKSVLRAQPVLHGD